MSAHDLFELSAFAEVAGGGNPAGVWVDDVHPDESTMREVAARLGHSETAFVAPAQGLVRNIRYFSPESEVPFCGHATIASGVALGRIAGAGHYTFVTPAGRVEVDVDQVGDRWRAGFVSVEPSYQPVPPAVLEEALAALGWSEAELDPALRPALASAGAGHLVLAAATRSRLDQLDYAFDRFRQLLTAHDLVTAQLVWRESDYVFHSRNPFPTGGVVEDPATGAAAAALGGYLREARLVAAPASLTIRQGEIMGRPSVLHVEIPATGGIRVSGSAVDLQTDWRSGHRTV